MARPEFSAGPHCSMMLVFKGKLAEAVADAVEGDQFVGELLQVDAVGEVLEGDGGGTGVAQALEGIEGPALALFGERVAQIEGAVGVAHAQGAQQLAVDGHLHQFGDDVIGQLDGLDELAGGLKPAGIHDLQQQAHQIELVDSRGLDAGRFGGNAMQKSLEHPLVNGADGHQAIAQTGSVGGLMRQRLVDIRNADQICLDQQIT